MSPNFQHIIPQLPPTAEVFASHQLTYEFRREVVYREDFKQYCDWYYLTAQKHREEYLKMQRDINIFSWFRK